MLLAVAAGILLAVAVTGWALLHKPSENLTAQTAVLDLRDRSPARGGEANPSEPPLEISRRVRVIKVYLPLGSVEGPYEMRVVTRAGNAVFATSTVASFKGGLTSIETAADLSSAPTGQYILQVRRPDSEWNSYPLVLQ